MPSFIKTALSSRMDNYLKLQLLESISRKPTASNLGIELSGTPRVTLLSGKEAGEEVTEIKANQRIEILLGTIKPHRWHVTLQENPILHQYGTPSIYRLIEPDDKEIPLIIVMDVRKAFRIEDLEWLLRIYLRE